MVFSMGNPEVEEVRGRIHLFRESDSTESDRSDSAGGVKETGSDDARALPHCRSDIVCVLAVPARMSTAEFCNWMGGYSEMVVHMRTVRDGSPNKYMVLMRFEDQRGADMFYAENNLKFFSSMHNEVCHLLFVKRLEFVGNERDSVLLESSAGRSGGGGGGGGNESGGGKPVELPTCPVCLERLDTSETGLITSICNHTFHCSCLSKWRSDAGCPVCRCCLDAPDNSSTQRCHACERTVDLWICLICGNLGCGRYEDGHAFAHFAETQHTYALDIESQRVWDYAGDGYVHRIIQNKADGKLVEVASSSSSAAMRRGGGGGGDADDGKSRDRKVDDVITEYNYLLSSQLETQRAFYESRLAQAAERVTQLTDELDAVHAERGELNKRVRAAESANARLEARVAERQAEHAELTARCDMLQQINDAMRGDRKSWQQRLDDVERAHRRQLAEQAARTDDLVEQVRDLSFFIEASKAVEKADSSNAELQDGSVVVVQDNSPSKALTRGHRRRRGTRGRARR
jgi:BRCA1-associated protein